MTVAPVVHQPWCSTTVNLITSREVYLAFCASGAFRCLSVECQQQPKVVVTREAGKNGKLKAALEKQGISVLELPLVETSPGPDRHDTCPASYHHLSGKLVYCSQHEDTAGAD